MICEKEAMLYLWRGDLLDSRNAHKGAIVFQSLDLSPDHPITPTGAPPNAPNSQRRFKAKRAA